jgi:TonB-dependent starch-binding outer membrane protein SusC
VYISANNLFTITQFLGRNPDATSIDNVLQNGFSQANYPIAKSFLAGFNLTF